MLNKILTSEVPCDTWGGGGNLNPWVALRDLHFQNSKAHPLLIEHDPGVINFILISYLLYCFYVAIVCKIWQGNWGAVGWGDGVQMILTDQHYSTPL